MIQSPGSFDDFPEPFSWYRAVVSAGANKDADRGSIDPRNTMTSIGIEQLGCQRLRS
jgi:hypothetical protein